MRLHPNQQVTIAWMAHQANRGDRRSNRMRKIATRCAQWSLLVWVLAISYHYYTSNNYPQLVVYLLGW